MQMHVYRSRFLRRAEIWFDNEPDQTQRVDWILYHQRSQPVAGAKSKPFYSFLIDLSRSAEELLARMSPDTGQKIRQAAARDKIRCECCDVNDPAMLDRFERMHNRFAAKRGLPPLDRAKFTDLAAVGLLDLTAAKDPQGGLMVFHANYRDQHRASGLWSVSLHRDLPTSAARNAVGRANRYLVWSDMLRYREQGLKFFDFGGWYPGNTDEALLKLNEFKRGFGGQVVREYES